MALNNIRNLEEFSMERGEILYDHILTYMVGLISLVTLHNKSIREKLIELPEVTIEGTVKEHINFSLKPFKPWLENLHKAANQKYLINYTIWISEKALSVCYESIEDKNDGSPILEFFRHVRNGVSHNNKFFFKTYRNKKTKKIIKEPVKKAVWRNKEILRDLQGRQVIPNFITPGDVLILLHDVNKYLSRRKFNKPNQF